MLEAIRNQLAGLRDMLGWVPDNVVGAAILAVAALVALAVHRTLVRMAARFFGQRRPHVRTFLSDTRGLSRFALVIVALAVALPAARLDADATFHIARLLTIAAIATAGWFAIKATNFAAGVYLVHFRVDGEENLSARKHITQISVLQRTVNTLLVVVTVAAALMTFESVRQYGLSLLASAGVAGLIAGLAARPLLSNLFAGIQIAMSQPIRIDDGVYVESEYGRVEEITSTYVVIRLWDLRRMIVPLSYFIEKPFQNWTRESSSTVGAVLLYVDYTTPVERVREKAIEFVKASPSWDGDLVKLQVTNATAASIELRIIASARSSGDSFDLRCELREKLIDFLQREIPTALPRTRQETVAAGEGSLPAH